MLRSLTKTLRAWPVSALTLLAALAVLVPAPARAAPAATEPTRQTAAGSTGAQPARVLRLESVEITGAFKTRPTVIRRLLGLSPGDALTPASLAAARGRLLASGYFRSVNVSTRPGAERGDVVLVLDLRERHLPYLDTGFGWRDPEGWYLNVIGLRAENPLGLGGRATAGARLGFRTAGSEAELFLPLTADRRLALRLRVGRAEEQALWYQYEPGWQGLYDEHRLKLDRLRTLAALEWRPRPELRLSVGFAGQSVDPREEAENRDTDQDVPFADLPDFLHAEPDRLHLHGLQLGLMLGRGGMDGRPGTSLHLAGTLVRRGLGADRDYARVTAALRATVALPAGRSLALGLRAGAAGGDAPWYERFRLGGSYSVRGFRDHSLSPLAGHRRFWTASAELRFPLIGAVAPAEPEPRTLWRLELPRRREARLTGVLFLDAGQGWAEESDLDPLDAEVDFGALNLGAGYGVRLRLPWVGIVGMDVGMPVTAGVTGEAAWVTLTLGHSF